MNNPDNENRHGEPTEAQKALIKKVTNMTVEQFVEAQREKLKAVAAAAMRRKK